MVWRFGCAHFAARRQPREPVEPRPRKRLSSGAESRIVADPCIYDNVLYHIYMERGMLPSTGFSYIDGMSDQQIQALKDRLERSGPRRQPKSEIVLGVLVFTGITAFVVPQLLTALLPDILDRTWRGMAVLAGATFLAASVGFWARELKRFWFYGVIEIGIGVVIATQVAAKADLIVALIGFVGAVRITLDGIARLSKLFPPAPEPATGVAESASGAGPKS